MVPIVIGYLGSKEYGLWLSITSFAAMATFADLGLGQGLTAALANRPQGTEQLHKASVVSSAFYLMLASAVSLALIVLTLYVITPFGTLYSERDAVAEKSASKATLVVLINVIIAIPLSIPMRVQVALLQGYRASVGPLLGAIGSSVLVIITINADAGIVLIAWASTIGPAIGGLCAWYQTFFVAKLVTQPQLKDFDFTIAKSLAKSGAGFFVLQVLAAVGNASDPIVINRILGDQSVSEYTLIQRAFQLTLIAQFFVTALMPAFGNARATGDIAWLSSAIRKTLFLGSCASVVVAIPLASVCEPVIKLWSGLDISPSTALLLGFVAWSIMAVWGAVISAFMSEKPLLYQQIVWYTLGSVSTLALKITGALYLGLTGVIWGTVLGYSIIFIIPCALIIKASLDTQK